MIINADLIAYEYYKDQYTLNDVYRSGEKDETSLNDKYGFSTKNLAILTLKDDIINNEGKGLKKGFYNITPDKYLDYLLFYQSGKLKAKIPVIETEILETNNPTQQKVKKMSYNRYIKEQEKEYRKYLKGENPKNVDWKEVEIEYLQDKNIYIITYFSNIVKLTGVIKL